MGIRNASAFTTLRLYDQQAPRSSDSANDTASIMKLSAIKKITKLAKVIFPNIHSPVFKNTTYRAARLGFQKMQRRRTVLQ
jgi:hypothetical protein